jgi:cytosine/adenosine deaminase-related metal-dependent hydrolase
MLLRARILLPVSAPPIEDGAVLVSGNRVVTVGRWRDLSSQSGAQEPAIDLGAVILLPGLVNAHCHLDYTRMVGLSPPRQFADWIKGLLAFKAHASFTDYADAWLRGSQMLLQTGTTTVADIEAVFELLPDVWSGTPLRVFSFLEMTGVKSKKPPKKILEEAAIKIGELKSQRCSAGLSPHALYSTTPALLQTIAEESARQQWRVTMHVAESMEEFEMVRHGRGPLFDWLKNQRDMSDCGKQTPVELIHSHGLLGERFLAIHANYLEAADIQILAETRSSVVHCPRSHAYFCHQPFPYEELAAAGVNVCLGTDSLASVIKAPGSELKLNMFLEMQTFAAAHPTVSPSAILQLATRHGARALGIEDQIGEISNQGLADLITIPFGGRIDEAEASVVHYYGNVSRCMIGGQWQFPQSA